MRLSPIIHPEVKEYLQRSDTLSTLTDAMGSPIHVIFPGRIDDNISAFQNVYEKTGIKGTIHYAAKANKSDAVLEHVAKNSIGVDVSSLHEFRAALSHGIIGHRIGVSGPSKDQRLLLLALQHESVITIDSPAELEYLIGILRTYPLEHPAKIMIRVDGLTDQKSRFGVPRDVLPNLLTKLSSLKHIIHLQGYSFHLADYSIEERQRALLVLIHELQKARDAGFPCTTLNIGGGYTVNYIQEQAWEAFQASVDTSTFFKGKQFTDYYPYATPHAKEAHFENILTLTNRFIHKALCEVLREQDIHLSIEPGRALLDQAGITIMRIKNIKTTAHGESLVEVEGNINHLSEQWFGTDFIPDPLHLPALHSPDFPFEASVSGNTCLEIDMVTWRKITFNSVPRRGDLLVYCNTAAYQMDSNESEFHRLPLPEKITAFKQDGIWRWKKDSQYSILDSLTPHTHE